MRGLTFLLFCLPLISSVAVAGDWLTDVQIRENVASTPSNLSSNKYVMDIHNKYLAEKAKQKTELLFVGDSITHNFTKGQVGEGEKGYQRGINVWNKYYAKRKALNTGISGDTTQGVLWRLQNGILDGMSPKVIVLTIGHNNSQDADVIADGMLAILKEMRTKCPDSTILFIPHFPTTGAYWKDSKQNKAWRIAVEKVKGDSKIIPLDLNKNFINDQGILKDKALIPDNIHPAEPGYQVWAESMEPTLAPLLGDEEIK